MAMKHDLMFLELLLGMIIKHRDEGEEECDKWISRILYNQNGPKYFIHSKARDLCNQVNPELFILRLWIEQTWIRNRTYDGIRCGTLRD